MKTRFTLFQISMLIGFLMSFSIHPIYGQFTPGEGGTLPTFPTFETIPNKVSGFFVETSDRNNYSFTPGTYAVVNMKFPLPSTFEATTYTLQYSEDNGTIWKSYQHNGADLTSDYNNFSLSPDGNYKYRLLLNGGPKDGYTSNEEYAPLSNINSMFTSYSLDEAMWITGIMLPNIGRGLEASFGITNLIDSEPIEGYLTSQWYRIDPNFEMTFIEGATNLKYITTDADAGYDLCIIATGDGVNVGGFKKVISSWGNIIPNKAFASNVSNSGFTLNLFKVSNGLNVADLELRDKDYNIVSISTINQGSSAAIYNIAATLDFSKTPYYLTSNNRFWSIVQEMGEGFTMTGLSVDFTTNVEALKQDNFIINRGGKKLYIKSKLLINKMNIIDLTGKTRITLKPESMNSQINCSSLNHGIYIVRISTKNGEYRKKIVL